MSTIESAVDVWEVEVVWAFGEGPDPRAEELGSLLSEWLGRDVGRVRVQDVYYLDGPGLDADRVEAAAGRLLADAVTQRFEVRHRGAEPVTTGADALGGSCVHVATILKKPGVMEPVEASLRLALSDLDLEGVRARLARRVAVDTRLEPEAMRLLADKVLANPVIEEVYWDVASLPEPFAPVAPYRLSLRRVELDGLSDEELLRVSRDGQLSLDLEEMRTIRDHFRARGTAPSDVELETIAQTWSEHCCHKTLTASIRHRREPEGETLEFGNLLRETIGRATDEIRRSEDPAFCLSVFRDNAGVVAFDERYGISFKVETHNHPSAIEPYGGAGTGIGGVLRDTLGTGLGAKPIVNTDVFCLGPPDLPHERLPPGALHPLRVLRGVVGGVRDYGNRMGIPTASGALFFDERYVGNPLVYCGSIGILPRDAVDKHVEPGDRIVLLGGRTGRDGIHGATFSSVELTEESETVSSGAVQIGDAITEKKLLDVLLEARDRKLYRAVTDCGAGGLSSAVGEMGESTGAHVELTRVPLKYEGLSYWEIWISEAQERMVLAVPPERVDELALLAASEDVECTDIGQFTPTGRLELDYGGERVADLEMRFLHEGRPAASRESTFERVDSPPSRPAASPAAGEILRRILASPNVASKEWVIRQYDHEVQGGSVLKPLQGPGQDGPGDGVVFTPVADSLRGVVVGCGMNPRYGDLDPYRMALSALDEALRNVVAVGGDPDRTAVLDNFCWGSVERPEALGGLVEAAIGCRDAALLLGTPFISGKDSLNNDYRVGAEVTSIPPSLLISSMALVDDVRRLVSMDLKRPGNRLVLVGETRAELGGSHFLAVTDGTGGSVPGLAEEAPRIHRALHAAIESGLVRSCHDLSEGGLGAAAAEMAFAGDVGLELRLDRVPRGAGCEEDLTVLFSESNSRFLLEVEPERLGEILDRFAGLPVAEVGETIEYHIFRVLGLDGSTTVLAEALADLREAWKRPLAL